jgi:sigma-E factor negative regulatory protein RseA
MDRISAFMDGETKQHETEQVILHLKQHQEHLESWHTFHLIGDAMRGAPMLRNDFTTRLRSRLQQEPTVLAPRLRWRKPLNFALSAAASLAAVAVVLTLVTFDNPLKPPVPIAKAPQPAVPPQVAQAVARPHPAPAVNQGNINEYLMAHQEFSPSTALQGFAPYVRTVSVAHGVDGR